MNQVENLSLDDACINTIRTLAMDAVQKANSGHPGTPMALAPLGYVLWSRFLRHNPRNPAWPDRDRFVLSNGHASMLLYALLHLSGYAVSLEDIRNFRQWGSCTPGHPEHGLTAGVEATTGPLGQGFMNAVGMAMAESHLRAVFNTEQHRIVDHHIYVVCSDGDLMEGASHEAASLAGHLGLGRLIAFYDDNHISIEGPTEITASDDVARRFRSYHWHVQDLGERANDIEALSAAIENARAECAHPSLIIIRSHIAWGAPTKQDTPEAHGAPLGEEEVRKTKQHYGWPDDEQFLVPPRVLYHMRQKTAAAGARLEADWLERFAEYERLYPELAHRFSNALTGTLPQDWDQDLKPFDCSDGPLATREASGRIINMLAPKIPFLIGGSGDLAPSTNTLIDGSGYFQRSDHSQRNVAWGVREHVMCAASNGLALHGGLRPFAATFLVFTDYARPAIRLACLTRLPVIYVMTHDSIGLGEDGPTHQPIEHLAAMRAMPNLCVIRPADANEMVQAWRAALQRNDGPTMLVLTRQKVPILDRRTLGDASGLLKGAYVLARENANIADLLLIATGSEVHLILDAREKLRDKGIEARCISMPSWELFREQDPAYRDSVLPTGVTTRLAVEAASALGWKEWVGDQGDVLGIDRFGASAPGGENFERFGFTADNVVLKAMQLLSRSERVPAS